MSSQTHLLQFIDAFQRALAALAGAESGQTWALQALQSLLDRLLEEDAPLVISQGGGRLSHRGVPIEDGVESAGALAALLAERDLEALVFRAGAGPDDLQMLFFALLMPPDRVREMGGAAAILGEAAPVQAIPRRDEPPTRTEVPQGPPTAEGLAGDLGMLFMSVVQMTAAPPRSGVSSPWSQDQREALSRAGLLQPDFSGLAGTGESLGLGEVDTPTLRKALRMALSQLDAGLQGSLVLGLPSLPSREQALLSALDYLAPELLAQAVSQVARRDSGSRFELGLLVSAMLVGIHDRGLALEAIRGRLQLDGWSLQELDELQEAILWECQGTDTKVRLTLMERGIFDLDVRQARTFARDLVRGRRQDQLRNLVVQLESGFVSPEVLRRRFSAQMAADLADCLEGPGLADDLGRRLQKLLHEHVSGENDEEVVLWSTQGLESLLVHWMQEGDFEGIYQEMMALSEIILLQRSGPEWKLQAVRNLLARLGSPVNMALLSPMLHQKGDPRTHIQLHALLSLMGRPAASYLMACLEIEEDRERRAQMLDALKAIGRNAIPALLEALDSPAWFQARNAALLLGEIGDATVSPELARLLHHGDARVRRAAMNALAALGSADGAAAALAPFLAAWEGGERDELLEVLSRLRSVQAVPALAELLRHGRSQSGETASLRVRLVEVLGAIGLPEVVEPLKDLFRKKGFLGGREPESLRLCAARVLVSLRFREAREAVATVLELEPSEEIRGMLRQYLVS
nr:HEAT repeat domain-containing protein [uncultured Holophaga sp.]